MSAEQYLTIDEGPGQYEIPCLPGGSEPEPLDWLLAVLQASIMELAASGAAPLQKANALARLAGLYLRSYGARGLERENKALRRRLTDLEERVAAAEAAAAAFAAPAMLPAACADEPGLTAARSVEATPESSPGPKPLDRVGYDPELGPATETVFLTPARMESPIGAGQPVPGCGRSLPAAQAASRSPP